MAATTASDGKVAPEGYVVNPKWQALVDLKQYVDNKNANPLGFTARAGGEPTSIGSSLADGIDDDGTWTGPLATEESAGAKTDVESLASTFTGLSAALSNASSSAVIDKFVPKDSPEASWPN